MQLVGHKNMPVYSTMSLDGRVLMSISGQRPNPEPFPIIVWDLTTGKELAHFPAIDGAHRFKLSGDGQRLAVTFQSWDKIRKQYRHRVHVWEVPTKKQLLTLKDVDRIGDIALSPDGKRLAVAKGRISLCTMLTLARSSSVSATRPRSSASPTRPMANISLAAVGRLPFCFGMLARRNETRFDR